jgi:putative transcriptional regulator
MAVNPTMDEIMQSSYQSLLLAYAAGVLDQAQHLIVASHIALRPEARKFVHTCEAVGGTLIEKHCEPVPMKDCSLGKVLDKIMNPCGDKAGGPCNKADCDEAEKLALRDLPPPLQRILIAQQRALHWRRVMAGLEALELELQCRRSHSRFLKFEPGRKAPSHHHGGLEITLVLNGAFHDDTGLHKRGDLLVIDERSNPPQQACSKDGCIALVVSAAPMRLTGIAALLHPFMRF